MSNNLKGLKLLEDLKPTIEQNAPVYSQSQGVTDAYNQMQSQLQNKPGEYQSQYQQKIDTLVDQILNRQKFSYDMNADPVYNQYKQQYMAQGDRAMRDTMGQAAMLTGGYGNSYAAAAGNQAYNDYLSKLNTVVPQLQQNARAEYDSQGNVMHQNVNMLQGLEGVDYGKYRDSMGDWRDERDYFSRLYDSQYSKDYGMYQDQLGQYNADRNYLAQLAKLQQDQANYDAQWTHKLDSEAASSQKSSSSSKASKDAFWKALRAAYQSSDHYTYDLLTRQGLESGYFTDANAVSRFNSQGLPYIRPKTIPGNKIINSPNNIRALQ